MNKFIAINGRDASPVSPNGVTSTDSNVWIYSKGLEAINQHGVGTGSYATADCISAVYNTGQAEAGIKMPPQLPAGLYDVYVYGRAYTTPGVLYKVKNGAAANPAVNVGYNWGWYKVCANVALAVTDTLSFVASAGGARVDIRDIYIVEAGSAAPATVPTGQEGVRMSPEWAVNYFTGITEVDLPQIDTVGRIGVTKVEVVDSFGTSPQAIVASSMTDGGTLGSGRVWSVALDKKATDYEVNG